MYSWGRSLLSPLSILSGSYLNTPLSVSLVPVWVSSADSSLDGWLMPSADFPFSFSLSEIAISRLSLPGLVELVTLIGLFSEFSSESRFGWLWRSLESRLSLMTSYSMQESAIILLWVRALHSGRGLSRRGGGGGSRGRSRYLSRKSNRSYDQALDLPRCDRSRSKPDQNG